MLKETNWDNMKKNCGMSEKKNNAETKLNNKRKRKMDKIKKAEKLNGFKFSKRKLGLLNKAIELSILCQSKTALIITSSNNNKLYACGSPNCDAVIQRFLNGHMVEDGKKKKEDDDIAETLRLQYEALQGKLEEEEDNLKSVNVTETEKSDFNFHDWWNNSIDDMNLASLEDFKTSLKSLKCNLRAASEAEKSNLHPNLNIAT